MIITAEGSDYKPVPAGAYMASCVRVIDLGTQTGNFGPKRQVLITWEVPEVSVTDQYGDDKPALISASYTASLSDKANLRQVLKSWRGKDFTADELKGFDLKNVLGAPCMINVVHKEVEGGKVFANVATVMPMPKGVPAPAKTAELINFDLEAFSREAFDKLSPKLKEKIEGTPEFKAATGEPAHEPQPGDEGYGDMVRDIDDEIPF